MVKKIYEGRFWRLGLGVRICRLARMGVWIVGIVVYRERLASGRRGRKVAQRLSGREVEGVLGGIKKNQRVSISVVRFQENRFVSARFENQEFKHCIRGKVRSPFQLALCRINHWPDATFAHEVARVVGPLFREFAKSRRSHPSQWFY